MAQGFQLVVSASGGERIIWILGLTSIVAGLLVMVGFLTPVASIVTTLEYGAVGISMLLYPDITKHVSVIDTLSLSLTSAALALLGPGAYSIDARLFGRREIIIPKSRRPSK